MTRHCWTGPAEAVPARAHPHITFYAYTKSVERFHRLVERDAPPNFRRIFSYGGTQDALIDTTRDRVADVFPDEEAIEAAGFSSQEDSDLLVAFGPPKVGIPANNIPHLKRLLGGRSDVADAGRARRAGSGTP